MIYWFTGQPGHGKTVLAKMFKEYLNTNYSHKKIIHIDGDDLRNIFDNKNYTKKGREQNIRRAQDIAKFMNHNGYDVIVSLVAPYRELREEFKESTEVKEIYVHTTDIRGREMNHVKNYEPPLENFIDIDTTDIDAIGSLVELINKVEV
jgi:adenylylsulfate kinase-like enzyme